MKRIIKFMKILKKMETSELEAIKILTETELRNRSIESEIRTKFEAEQETLRKKMDESNKNRKENLMNTVINFR